MLSKASLLNLVLSGISSASSLLNTSRFQDASMRLTLRDATPWPYGVIGDSWGSGIAYNEEVLYDGNLDNCLRTKESHGPQMESDTSWTGAYSSGLRDAACSGSTFLDFAKGHHQMGKVGNPDVVIMTSVGNNARFGLIVDFCVYHANSRHNYGPAYKDDDLNNPKGDCALALKWTTNYINENMGQELVNTINDVFNDASVINKPDFLLYVTGYAQFFGTDYDPWCEQEHWNVANLFSPMPYLSKELRTVFNERVSDVNILYRKVIPQSQFANRVRFIDIDAGFQGHRFCEPGATHNDQLNTDTNFDGVYLWNLNWPWQVANVPAPPGVNASGPNVNQTIAIFGDGGGVTAWSPPGGSGSGGEDNVPSNGWRLRPFHPRYTGFTSIKNAILAQLKNDGLPKALAPPPPPPPPPAYATGTCCFHLDEWEDCDPQSDDLFANITLVDNNKNVIYQTPATDFAYGELGEPINTDDGATIQGPLPNPLAITGEHEHDYIQFTYGGLSWQSDQASGGAQCSVGGWNPRDGPVCDRVGELPPPDMPGETQMDYCFPC